MAGLEAARGAALRGHSVVLFERRPQLGTALAWLAGDADASARRATSTGCETRRKRPGRRLRTGVAVTTDDVLAEAPDAVIVATESGLRPSAALSGPVPALDVDALLERGVPEVKSRLALVLDDEGGFLAPTAAERLVADGFAVEIAATHPVVGAGSIRRGSRSSSADSPSPASS